MGQKVGRPFDRSGNQLRKETDKCKESNHVMGGLYFMLIYINGIAQGLKGIETDSHRQKDV